MYTLCVHTTLDVWFVLFEIHSSLLLDYPFSIHKQLVLCFVFFFSTQFGIIYGTLAVYCHAHFMLVALSGSALSLYLATCWFGICARSRTLRSLSLSVSLARMNRSVYIIYRCKVLILMYRFGIRMFGAVCV